MKHNLILVLWFFSGAALLQAAPGNGTTPTADEVVATMFARDGLREAAGGGYTGRRVYVLENDRFHKRAQMQVSVSCERNGTKHFEVQSEDGWKSANTHVLRKMVESESNSSRPDMRPKSRITADNYTFRLIETSQLEGRMAYVIEATPKRQDQALFRGRIWVDGEDFALARVEGEPAKNPSFWTKRVRFVQRYHKDGPLWFPFATTSVTEAHIFGTTNVNIQYLDYKPVSVDLSALQHR